MSYAAYCQLTLRPRPLRAYDAGATFEALVPGCADPGLDVENLPLRLGVPVFGARVPLTDAAGRTVWPEGDDEVLVLFFADLPGLIDAVRDTCRHLGVDGRVVYADDETGTAGCITVLNGAVTIDEAAPGAEAAFLAAYDFPVWGGPGGFGEDDG